MKLSDLLRELARRLDEGERFSPDGVDALVDVNVPVTSAVLRIARRGDDYQITIHVPDRDAVRPGRASQLPLRRR